MKRLTLAIVAGILVASLAGGCRHGQDPGEPSCVPGVSSDRNVPCPTDWSGS